MVAIWTMSSVFVMPVAENSIAEELAFNALTYSAQHFMRLLHAKKGAVQKKVALIPRNIGPNFDPTAHCDMLLITNNCQIGYNQ